MLPEPLRKLGNLAQDRRLGVRTRGAETTVTRPGAVYYATADYAATRRVLRRLDLQRDDVFVDVGAGKGRVLCCAARRRLERVVGVEYDQRLAGVARSNVARLRGRLTPVDVHTRAAEDFNYSGATALYLFNPFEADVLGLVLGKIGADLAGGPVRLAFVMESPAQRAVFEQHAWLECRERWSDGGHRIALYQSR
jgi:SAM-dependent methyltransferase